MTTQQPEALRLAELLETDGLNPASTVRMDAAAELRRLHEVDQELLGARKGCLLFPGNRRENEKARAAIARAEGVT